MHAGEADHARPRWTTLMRGHDYDSSWKGQSEWQRTEINGESTSMVWPALGSMTAKEQNSRGQNVDKTRNRGQYYEIDVFWPQSWPWRHRLIFWHRPRPLRPECLGRVREQCYYGRGQRILALTSSTSTVGVVDYHELNMAPNQS